MDLVESTQYDRETCYQSVRNLLGYCQKNDWSGFDPYDVLNSRLYAGTPLYDNRICSVALTQIMKRLPFNLRPLLCVPREQNSKAIGLFLTALLKLSRLGLLGREDLPAQMIDRLVALRSPNTPYWCWGYSFPWQTRTIRVPRAAPNLVCTSFVANALLDAYEQNHQARCLEMAVSAADYLLEQLYWTEGDTVGFSYPLPRSRPRVHNANFLGAALLCRTYRQTGDKRFLEPALKAARYSAARQHEDGSWDYGETATQQWVDNFHTGYNLCALRAIGTYAETSEFEAGIRRGFHFYRNNFFRADGAPKYFHDRAYPLDVHGVAQSIITLLALQDLDEGSVGQAQAVFEWAMKNLWDEQGYFYYQVLPYYKNKISYMRWSQAWMLLALSTFLEHHDRTSRGESKRLSGLSRQS